MPRKSVAAFADESEPETSHSASATDQSAIESATSTASHLAGRSIYVAHKPPSILQDPDDEKSTMQRALQRSFKPVGSLQRFDIASMSRLLREILLSVALLNGVHRQNLNIETSETQGNSERLQPGAKSSAARQADGDAGAAGSIASLESLIAEGTDLELLKRLMELLRQLKKSVRTYHKRRLEKCRRQLFRIKHEVALKPYNQMPLPEPKEAYEHIEHFSDLGDDVHFAGPNKPDRPEMPEVLSVEWIDQLGPPSLLEQDDPEAYAYLLRERMGDLPTDSQFAVLLVKLLCDLEWFEQRYAVIEAKLLYPKQEVNERATQQRTPEDEEAQSSTETLEVVAVDGVLNRDAQKQLQFLDQVSCQYIENKEQVVELFERQGLLAVAKDLVADLVRELQDDDEALERAKLAHKSAVRHATFKKVF
jgi:hypothetical protein